MNFSKKSHGLIVASGLSFLLAFSPMGSAFAEENAPAESNTNIVQAGTDPAAKNLTKTENYVNHDLSVLPDNVNWDGERKTFEDVDKFGGSVKLPDTSTPYSVADFKETPGINEPTIGNAEAFGWDLNYGAVSISREGKAYKSGTGESGIINPENKENIIWFGKYRKNPEPEIKKDIDPLSIAKRAWIPWEKLNGDLFKDAKYSILTGEYCILKDYVNSSYPRWDDCSRSDVDKSTKKVFSDYTDSPIGKYTMLTRADLKNGQHIIVELKRTVYPRFNAGVKQAVDVTPGSEIVITPSWVSNGNVKGTDQLQLRIYDATGKQISDFPNWSTDRPVMLYKGSTNRPEVGTQGFVWKVPEDVTRIFTTFRQADETADHTGLADKSAVAISGFTGATVTTGSHLTMAAAATNDPAKQIVNKPFDFELVVTSDGYAATANGEFSAELPQGVTAESVVVKTADGKEVAGTIKDGKIVAPLSKMNVGDEATVLLKGIKLPVAQKWNLLNPVLSYNTFALNGGYTDAAEFTDPFHIVHPYTISLSAKSVSTVDEGTQTDPTETDGEGTQTEPSTTGEGAAQTGDNADKTRQANTDVAQPAKKAKAGKKHVPSAKGLPTTGSQSMGIIGLAGAAMAIAAGAAMTRRNRNN